MVFITATESWLGHSPVEKAGCLFHWLVSTTICGKEAREVDSDSPALEVHVLAVLCPFVRSLAILSESVFLM